MNNLLIKIERRINIRKITNLKSLFYCKKKERNDE